MDGRSVQPGLVGGDVPQVLPSVTAARAPQRAEATPAEAQTIDTPGETRQEKQPHDLTREVEFANAVAEFLNQKVSFSYDKRIDQIVVKVTRGETEELIRQIPSEEMIKMIAKLRQDFRGLIFNRTV